MSAASKKIFLGHFSSLEVVVALHDRAFCDILESSFLCVLERVVHHRKNSLYARRRRLKQGDLESSGAAFKTGRDQHEEKDRRCLLERCKEVAPSKDPTSR